MLGAAEVKTRLAGAVVSKATWEASKETKIVILKSKVSL